MTTEQEAVAKWQIVEDYKKTKERMEALRAQIAKWGDKFVQVGGRMRNQPDSIGEGEVTTLPDMQTLASTVRELREAYGCHEQLVNRMRGIGLEPGSFFR
jgi:hypothetical protein